MGQWAIGASSRIHTAKILQLSMDLPFVVEIVDTEERINGFLSGSRRDDERRACDSRKGAGDSLQRRQRPPCLRTFVSWRTASRGPPYGNPFGGAFFKDGNRSIFNKHVADLGERATDSNLCRVTADW